MKTAAGQSRLSGALAYSPTVRWQLAGDIRGFDPGFFAPDFPGTLSADLASSGSIDDGGVQLRADLATLRGRVRGRVVSGSARRDQRAGQIGRASCRERVCKYE